MALVWPSWRTVPYVNTGANGPTWHIERWSDPGFGDDTMVHHHEVLVRRALLSKSGPNRGPSRELVVYTLPDDPRVYGVVFRGFFEGYFAGHDAATGRP